MRFKKPLKFISTLALVGFVIVFFWSRMNRYQKMFSGHEMLPLKIYGTVPDFDLLEKNGKKITRTDLMGKIWIADLIFTRCHGQCPFMTQKMVEQQGILPRHPKLMWLSISVDPDWDTPQRLTEYSVSVHADPQKWFFITGDKNRIESLILNGFRLAYEEAPGQADEPISHSDRFILIDEQAQIRGLYSATDEKALKNLRRDTMLLLERLS